MIHALVEVVINIKNAVYDCFKKPKKVNIDKNITATNYFIGICICFLSNFMCES